jgi:hypothetical protein
MAQNAPVKVFVSSVISGYEDYRAAVGEAIETFGHEVVRAEGFAASPSTPQQACLAAARDADLVVVLVGPSYGAVQASGLSATHEEYREARERTPTLIFVQSNVDRDEEQQRFLDEVQEWSTGRFRESYDTPEALKAVVLRGIHDFQLAMSAGPVDETEMVARARAVLPRRHGFGGDAVLMLAVAGGPRQQVLRPAELEDASLWRDIQREALFGDHSVLVSSEGTTVSVKGDALVLEQRVASVAVDQLGTVLIVQPARVVGDRGVTELPAVIEEDVVAAIGRALRFVGWVLDRTDPLRRVTDVTVVGLLAGAGYMPWRSRAEHAASPTSGTMGRGGDEVVVGLTPARRHRQALIHDPDRIAEDLVVLLRRGRNT